MYFGVFLLVNEFITWAMQNIDGVGAFVYHVKAFVLQQKTYSNHTLLRFKIEVVKVY